MGATFGDFGDLFVPAEGNRVSDTTSPTGNAARRPASSVDVVQHSTLVSPGLDTNGIAQSNATPAGSFTGKCISNLQLGTCTKSPANELQFVTIPTRALSFPQNHFPHDGSGLRVVLYGRVFNILRMFPGAPNTSSSSTSAVT
jgi:hypothetical protein